MEMMTTTDMTACRRVWGLLAWLLRYPDEEWRGQLRAVREEAASLPAATGRLMTAFLDAAEAADPLAWQELYVRTFDFGKKTNLYLTYGEHGEERERGAALLELKRRYAAAGFELAGGELPDYLPLMLEFAAAAPWEAAAELLAGRVTALSSIRRELAASGGPYAALFELLLQLMPAAAGAAAPDAGRELP